MTIESSKLKGHQGNLYMAEWAWDFLEELAQESSEYKRIGRGRIIEDLLLKEKSRRDKKKAESEKAAVA